MKKRWKVKNFDRLFLHLYTGSTIWMLLSGTLCLLPLALISHGKGWMTVLGGVITFAPFVLLIGAMICLGIVWVIKTIPSWFTELLEILPTRVTESVEDIREHYDKSKKESKTSD